MYNESLFRSWVSYACRCRVWPPGYQKIQATIWVCHQTVSPSIYFSRKYCHLGGKSILVHPIIHCPILIGITTLISSHNHPIVLEIIVPRKYDHCCCPIIIHFCLLYNYIPWLSVVGYISHNYLIILPTTIPIIFFQPMIPPAVSMISSHHSPALVFF